MGEGLDCGGGNGMGDGHVLNGVSDACEQWARGFAVPSKLPGLGLGDGSLVSFSFSFCWSWGSLERNV